jgi:hypothetical protein
MKMTLTAIALAAGLTGTLAAAPASAQGVNLSGRWLCVVKCFGPPGGFAVITQYDRDLNVVNDAGAASRAWVDYPGHIWIDRANEGAIYSPDALTLQFDSGTVWRRAPDVPPPPPVRIRR